MHPLVFVALLLLSTFTQDAIKTSRVPRVALQKQQQRSWNNRWPARCRFCCCPESLLSHAHGVKTIYTTTCIRRPNSALGSYVHTMLVMIQEHGGIVFVIAMSTGVWLRTCVARCVEDGRYTGLCLLWLLAKPWEKRRDRDTGILLSMRP